MIRMSGFLTKIEFRTLVGKPELYNFKCEIRGTTNRDQLEEMAALWQMKGGVVVSEFVDVNDSDPAFGVRIVMEEIKK